MISDDTIPILTRAVTVRREPNGFLLYQRETDELYFLSEAGYRLCEQFDGTRTVGELEQSVRWGNSQDSSQGREQFCGFLQSLADRSVIELWE